MCQCNKWQDVSKIFVLWYKLQQMYNLASTNNLNLCLFVHVFAVISFSDENKPSLSALLISSSRKKAENSQTGTHENLSWGYWLVGGVRERSTPSEHQQAERCKQLRSANPHPTCSLTALCLISGCSSTSRCHAFCSNTLTSSNLNMTCQPSS